MTSVSLPCTMADNFRGIMAAVINRALADLKKNRIRDHVKDEAMAWINSPECEAYCYTLDVDYSAVREQAAALYRRFLEKAEVPGKAPGRPRTRRLIDRKGRRPNLLPHQTARLCP
jgi:hypothetical protein